MANEKLSTGYEGTEFDDRKGPRKFDLSMINHYATSRGIPCSLTVNGVPSGLLYLSSQEEFEWLRGRIFGTFNPEGKSDD